MNFVRHHWYDIGFGISLILLGFLIGIYDRSSELRTIALLNLIVLLWRQFEAYRFPGGYPACFNYLAPGHIESNVDRYPLNSHNSFFINIVLIIAYALPVIFSKGVSLAFMPIAFGILYPLMTVYFMARRHYHGYVPGLFCSLFGHLPLGLYWLYVVMYHQWVGITDVLRGGLYLILFCVIFMLNFGFGLFISSKSVYPFTEDEMERGGFAKRLRQWRHIK